MLRRVLQVSARITADARKRSTLGTAQQQGSYVRTRAHPDEDVLEFSESEIEELKATIDSVTTKTLNLQESSFKRSRDIVYMDVHQGEDISIGVFVIPKGKVMPLHDHPFMTVLSKVLWGEMEVVSYTLSGDPLADIGRGRIALRHPLGVARTNDMQVLTPRAHNIHQFKARHSTAVLDVMIPPYDPDRGRSGHYFTPLEINEDQTTQGPLNGESGGAKRVFLKQVECPGDYYTAYQEYTGEVP